MFKILRIVFTILCVITIAPVFFIGAFFGWPATVLTVLLAFVFFGLTVLFKNLQEKKENPPTKKGDFLDPDNKE